MNELEKHSASVRLQEALAKGDLAKLLDTVSDDQQEVPRIKSAVARRTEMLAKLEAQDQTFLTEIKTAMDGYGRHTLPVADQPTILDQEAVDALANEYEDWQKLSDFLKMRQELMKTRVFDSLTESYEGKVTDRPATHVADGLVSDEHGIVFKREGGNRTASTLDWQKLESELPEEVYRQLCDKIHHKREVIPMHDEYVPNQDKLMEAISDGIVDMQVLKSAVMPGTFQSPRFTVRRVKKAENS